MKNTQENTLNDTNLNTNSIVTLEEGEDEECILPLPDHIIDALGWEDGDVLDWIVNDDNTITIKKVEQ